MKQINEEIFRSWLIQADTLRRVSRGSDAEFWAGYVRGLRRFHHGKRFGTDREHAVWLGIAPDDPDRGRRARGEGYRLGFAGKDPYEVITLLDSYLSTRELAEACGVGTSRIRQLAETIPGGRLTDAGWRFPPEAVEYVRGKRSRKSER